MVSGEIPTGEETAVLGGEEAPILGGDEMGGLGGEEALGLGGEEALGLGGEEALGLGAGGNIQTGGKSKKSKSKVVAKPKRSFRVVSLDGKKPTKDIVLKGTDARTAAKHITQTDLYKKKKEYKVKIKVCEITQGSAGKEFKYEVSRKKLKKPITVKFGKIMVTMYYEPTGIRALK
jgi:hypothetical protein